MPDEIFDKYFKLKHESQRQECRNDELHGNIWKKKLGEMA